MNKLHLWTFFKTPPESGAAVEKFAFIQPTQSGKFNLAPNFISWEEFWINHNLICYIV